MLPQQYCLRWKHHSTNVQSMFSQLLEKERFCDVTVCSGGVSVRCHRAVLAAGSPLLGALLAAHDALAEPVLVIDQAEPRHLRPLLRYLYTGEMSVHHSQLAGLLKTAEELRIKGLSDIKWSSGKGPQQAQPTATATASEETGSARWDAPETTRTDPRTDSLHSVNGGPPPLIKLPVQSPARKRELTNEPEECGQGSPKRSRMPSRSDNTDEEEREPDWAQHGQMQDYGSEKAGSESEPEEGGSESETDFPPQDLARFLDTRLRVDGEHVAGEDEDSKGTDEKKMDGSKQTTSGMGIKACAATTSSSSCNSSGNVSGAVTNNSSAGAKPGSSADPRFSDVVKLNDYLLHGRRPHFWEEDYVRRVMEAVRLKELEMKQAAEILGVSYGTLYGRYRDVYGCINRPYSSVLPRPRIKEFWSESSPAEVVQRVARGEVSLGQAADALAVPPQQLAAYITSLPAGGGSGGTGASGVGGTGAGAGRSGAATAVGGSEDAVAETSVEEPAPSGLRALRRTVAAGEKALKKLLVTDQDKPSTTPNKVPSIRVASLESLRAAPTQPNSVTADSTSPAAALLRTRPDLTIVPRGKPRLDSVT